jgi:hypothetical protein
MLTYLGTDQEVSRACGTPGKQGRAQEPKWHNLIDPANGDKWACVRDGSVGPVPAARRAGAGTRPEEVLSVAMGASLVSSSQGQTQGDKHSKMTGVGGYPGMAAVNESSYTPGNETHHNVGNRGTSEPGGRPQTSPPGNAQPVGGVKFRGTEAHKAHKKVA